MGEANVKVAHGLLKKGPAIGNRQDFLRSTLRVAPNTFRSDNNGGMIGAVGSEEGVRFFDSSKRNSLAFGPGAGLVVGISIGYESLRAAIFDANGQHHHLIALPPGAASAQSEARSTSQPHQECRPHRDRASLGRRVFDYQGRTSASRRLNCLAVSP